MYSWADRRLLEFFLERDYPSAETLRDILRRIPVQGLHKDELRESLRMDGETFERALEKLAVHDGVNVDYSDYLTPGDGEWSDPYAAQISRRQAQIDQVMQYADASQCRMAALVRHFGDREDGRRPCGKCDFCSPESCIAQQFRAPTTIELQAMAAALKALRVGQSVSTGQLHKQLFPREQMGRNEFEGLLGVLAGAGLVSMEDAVFEKEGRSINYRKISLSADAEDLEEGLLGRLMVKDGFAVPLMKAGLKKRATDRAAETIPEAELTGRAGELWEKLRAWRMDEAKKLGVRAFHILGNKTLRAVAIEEPRTLNELLSVSGIGPSKAEKFGEAICRVCSE
jgi:ATP-dependent DNA helicase RecQ